MTPSVRLRAGAAVLTSSDVRRGVELELEHGRIADLRAVPAADLSVDEAARVITPGLINAHTHLDLGALGGKIPPTGGFQDWVARLVEARAGLSPAEVDRGIESSVRALAGSGTTAVIDVDSSGRTMGVLSAARFRAVVLREVLDGSPAGFSSRSASALRGAEVHLNPAPETPDARDLVRPGLSPHATHTVGDELMARIAGLCRDHGPAGSTGHGDQVPVGIHWAETPEETDWLLRGEGPFAEWLGPSPELPGTERLRRAGLLERAILIHGNDPQPGEPERVAAAGGALVHCPGSHRFFQRTPFPLDRFQSAGVPMTLGTDSFASNDALDMRREMRLARETLGLGAETVWEMATERAARLLPWKHVTGRLEVGAAADLAVFKPQWQARASNSELFEELTMKNVAVVETWVEGVRIA